MTGQEVEGWCGRSTSVEQTRALGRAVAAWARRGDLIGLIGELGTGKTQFVKGVAEGLGLDPAAIASPTFVLMHEHEVAVDAGPDVEPAEGAGRELPAVLVHVDAYRLNTAADLESIGWADQFADAADAGRRDALVVVEWADRLVQVPGAVGPNRLEVHLSHAGDEVRLIECRACGCWRARAGQLAATLDALVQRSERNHTE